MNIEDLPENIRQQVIIEQQQKEIRFLTKELSLYRRCYKRPSILKEVIHHPSRPRDSICLYGISAWDEYIYE